jgi:translation elongation factor EF-G
MQVTNEDVVEGTSLFLLEALLPVAESFGESWFLSLTQSCNMARKMLTE